MAKRQIEKDCFLIKEKYEKANATFMRTKADAMPSGQPKPGRNTQVGTENNFVIGYDIFPNLTDTRASKPHLKNVMRRLGRKLKRV